MNTIKKWSYLTTIYFLKRAYGPRCKTLDINDFPELNHNNKGRCPKCKTYETIDFLTEEILIINQETQ